MKSVLISIRPQWCEKIASGEKTVEVRKSMPKLERPFKCYIYMSQGDLKDLGSYSEWIYKNRMKVIGEFICDNVEEYHYIPINVFFSTRRGYFISDWELAKMCLSYADAMEYGKGKPLYGWHISDLKIYDKPLSLSELGVTRPPQSYMLVEELK